MATEDGFPQAVVREVDGVLVLDDPVALAFIQAVCKNNCRATLKMNTERVEHFKCRVAELNKSPEEVVIVVVNVDDVHGGPLAEALMPGYNWQEIRDCGEIPFARGLAMREGIQGMLDILDQEGSGKKLREMAGVAVVVVDHGVTEVYEA
ncbi:MAG: hypothetical protein WC244_02270 [Patescibacteria group bacterium]|jgi:hypothetical protein